MGDAPATYEWGPRAQLLTASRVGANAEFDYDETGRMAGRTVDNVERRFRYDQDRLEAVVAVDPLGAETDLLHFAFAQDGRPIALREPEGDTFYYHYDAFGSVDRIHRGAQLAVRYIYDSDGRIVEEVQGPAWASVLEENPFRFMARYQLRYQPGLDLYDVSQRFYDPLVGRFLSRDGGGSYLPCWQFTCRGAAAALRAVGRTGPSYENPLRCESRAFVQPHQKEPSTQGFVEGWLGADCTFPQAHVAMEHIKFSKIVGSNNKVDQKYVLKPDTPITADSVAHKHHCTPGTDHAAPACMEGMRFPHHGVGLRCGGYTGTVGDLIQADTSEDCAGKWYVTGRIFIDGRLWIAHKEQNDVNLGDLDNDRKFADYTKIAGPVWDGDAHPTECDAIKTNPDPDYMRWIRGLTSDPSRSGGEARNWATYDTEIAVSELPPVTRTPTLCEFARRRGVRSAETTPAGVPSQSRPARQSR